LSTHCQLFFNFIVNLHKDWKTAARWRNSPGNGLRTLAGWSGCRKRKFSIKDSCYYQEGSS